MVPLVMRTAYPQASRGPQQQQVSRRDARDLQKKHAAALEAARCFNPFEALATLDAQDNAPDIIQSEPKQSAGICMQGADSASTAIAASAESASSSPRPSTDNQSGTTSIVIDTLAAGVNPLLQLNSGASDAAGAMVVHFLSSIAKLRYFYAAGCALRSRFG